MRLNSSASAATAADKGACCARSASGAVAGASAARAVGSGRRRSSSRPPRATAPHASADPAAAATPPPPPPPLPPLRRRAALALLAAAPLAATSAAEAAAAGAALPPGVPPPPADLGEVGGTLNDCPEAAASCVSSFSDDPRFFAAPWEYEGPRAAAISDLISVATGGAYDPGLARDALSGAVGVSRGDAAAFILGTTLTTIAGRPPPARPAAARRAAFEPFDGKLMERRTADDGSEYVWIVFGLPAADEEDDSSSSSSDEEEVAAAERQQKQQKQEAGGTAAKETAATAGATDAGATAAAAAGDAPAATAAADGAAAAAAAAVAADDDSSSSSSDDEEEEQQQQRQNQRRRAAPRRAADAARVIDAEFLFPAGDAIATVRAAARAPPRGPLAGARPALSLEDGLVLDRNGARREMERLRKALRWQLVPVLSADDAQMNAERPLFFERFFAPFVGANGPSTAGGPASQPR